jgi:lysozyme family protein
MAEFTKAIQKVLRHEGVKFGPDGEPLGGNTGYVDHPDDPGGETNYGVTKEAAEEYGYDGPMAEIPFATVLEIYRLRYWDKVRGDDIADQQLAEEIFDTGVNMGIGRTSRFLQRTLNVLNVKGTKYPDLKVDGDIGLRTINTLHRALNVKPWYRAAILRALDSLQCVHYI